MHGLQIGACLFVGACWGLLGACEGNGVDGFREREAPRPGFPFTVRVSGVDADTLRVRVDGKAKGHVVTFMKLETNCGKTKAFGNVGEVDVDTSTSAVGVRARCGSKWYGKRLRKIAS